MIDCPECDKPVRGSACACGWVVPPPFISRVAPPEPPKPYVRAKPETVEKCKRAVLEFLSQGNGWWKPERVRNEQQVALIVAAAKKFGPMSQQGRFLAQCKEAGVITPDNKLRVREMGEDGRDDIGEAA